MYISITTFIHIKIKLLSFFSFSNQNQTIHYIIHPTKDFLFLSLFFSFPPFRFQFPSFHHPSHNPHGSARFDSVGHRHQRPRRSRPCQIRHGPKTHGRPLHPLPQLQRHGSGHVYVRAVVGRRCWLQNMSRVGSYGV